MVIPAEPPSALLHMGSQVTSAVRKIKCQGVVGKLGARLGMWFQRHQGLDINGCELGGQQGNFRESEATEQRPIMP